MNESREIGFKHFENWGYWLGEQTGICDIDIEKRYTLVEDDKEKDIIQFGDIVTEEKIEQVLECMEKIIKKVLPYSLEKLCVNTIVKHNLNMGNLPKLIKQLIYSEMDDDLYLLDEKYHRINSRRFVHELQNFRNWQLIKN